MMFAKTFNSVLPNPQIWKKKFQRKLTETLIKSGVQEYEGLNVNDYIPGTEILKVKKAEEKAKK